jgi:hypothetical protein
MPLWKQAELKEEKGQARLLRTDTATLILGHLGQLSSKFCLNLGNPPKSTRLEITVWAVASE